MNTSAITAAQIQSAAKAAKISLFGQLYRDDAPIVEVLRVTKSPAFSVERVTVRKDDPLQCPSGKWVSRPIPLMRGRKNYNVVCLVEELEYWLT